MASSFANFSSTFIDKVSTFIDRQFLNNNDDQSMAAVYSVIALLVVIFSYNISSLLAVKMRKGRSHVEATDENNTRGLYGKPAILGIGTANPPYIAPKEKSDDFLEKFRDDGYSSDQIDFIKKIRDTCGIESRYSGVDPDALFRGESLFGKTLEESVERRNLYWMKYAKATAIEAARKAIDNWGGDKQKITHVVFHSCTGFKAPGIELDVIDALSLTGVKRRLGINFMGCFGGFTGISVAKSFCTSDPGGITLVVCAESCTAHLSNATDKSELLGSVIFADGAAACIVGPGQYGDWAIGNTLTKTLGKGTRDMMTWFPSDKNYRMYLSKEIGNQFGVGLLVTLRSVIKNVMGSDVSMGDAEWCVHPGGRGLLDGLAKGLGADKLRHSYETLRNYGNMSSPTIFFVIKRMLEDTKESQSKDAICLGFGPGLTAEFFALHKIV